jgi:Arc/MetJ-type ribon-helix-helix transcriptional regulator
MIQAKFSLEESHVRFLNQFKVYGFKDKSEIVRIALSRLQKELEQQSLQESAALYAEIYQEDAELQELTASALVEWPA